MTDTASAVVKTLTDNTVVKTLTDNQLTNNVTSNVKHASNWLISNEHLLITYAVNIVAAIFILLIGNFIAKTIAKGISKVLRKKEMDEAVIQFLHSLMHYGLLIIVFIAALSRVGVQTASVIAVIGAAGLAIGLALQGSLSNFAAGVLIVAFRPFKSGDYVEIDGVGGSVEAIQMFSSILRTPDNKMVVVPNAKVIGSPITNYSRHETRRIDFVIGVAYDADLKKTKEVLRRVVTADSRVLTDPEPTIGVVSLGDSSVNFVVRPWVKTTDYWGVYFDLMQAIKEELDKENIGIPFPQMDVHLNKVD
jgi:small conductance mechanosensitive channel